jgi:hypothetical protein
MALSLSLSHCSPLQLMVSRWWLLRCSLSMVMNLQMTLPKPLMAHYRSSTSWDR